MEGVVRTRQSDVSERLNINLRTSLPFRVNFGWCTSRSSVNWNVWNILTANTWTLELQSLECNDDGRHIMCHHLNWLSLNGRNVVFTYGAATRRYRGGSSKSARDPLKLKFGVYWHQNRKNEWISIKIGMWALFWSLWSKWGHLVLLLKWAINLVFLDTS